MNPAGRQLLHFSQPVDLSGKDFDLLCYLAQNPNVLVPTTVLTDAVWGSGVAIHHGNITNHIAKVRRALGCDPHNPTFIRTVHGRKGYIFIKPVKEITQESRADFETDIKNGLSESTIRAEDHRVRSHLFVPMYVGTGLFSEIKGPVRETQWIKYKEYPIENGRLCILPSGIAVWHLRFQSSFPTLTDMSAWRKRLYEEIFQNKHRLQIHTKELLARSKEAQTLFESVLGKPGYAYSLMVLQSSKWKDTEKVRRVLEILGCPKVLEAKNDSKLERERLRALERQFLEKGINSLDMREFGLAGDDIGFASWEGASYSHSAETADEASRILVEFQVAVHALWWLSKCLASAWLSHSKLAAEQLKEQIPDLKKQFLIIKNIEAKESTSQRMMEEAVLSVNRVEQIVTETIQLYS